MQNRINQLDFTSLACFLSICRTQSVSQTAHLLGISRSNVSERLYKIERLLGIPLFHREHKKIYTNEQGMGLAKYIFPLFLLEDFALRNVNQTQNIMWLNVSIPFRLYGGHLTQAFEKSIAYCKKKYPQILIWPKAIDTYDIQHHSDLDWHPDWEQIGKIKIDWRTEQQENEINLNQGNWCILYPKGKKININEAEQQFLVPRMPWFFIKQLNQLGFFAKQLVYVVQDYNDLLQRCEKPILLNSLLFNKTNISEKWQIRQLEHKSYLIGKSEGNHPIIHLFMQVFQEYLAMPEKAILPIWKTNTLLKHWHYLNITLNKKSITLAAQALYIVQSALSMQIKNFENTTQTHLIYRKQGKHCVIATLQGDFFYKISCGIEYLLQTLQKYVKHQKLNQEGVISLGILPSIDNESRLLQLIAHQVSSWQKEHPEIRLTILEERHHHLLAALDNQDLHLAILEADAPGINQLPLNDYEEMGLVISTQYDNPIIDKQEEILWQDLTQFDLVLPKQTTGMRLLIDRHCLNLDVQLMPAMESDSLNINQYWIRQGIYASILPKSAVASLIQQKEVTFIPLYPKLYRQLRVAFSASRILSPIEQSLIEKLRCTHLP